jgi:hypothetical protein
MGCHVAIRPEGSGKSVVHVRAKTSSSSANDWRGNRRRPRAHPPGALGKAKTAPSALHLLYGHRVQWMQRVCSIHVQ